MGNTWARKGLGPWDWRKDSCPRLPWDALPRVHLDLATLPNKRLCPRLYMVFIPGLSAHGGTVVPNIPDPDLSLCCGHLALEGSWRENRAGVCVGTVASKEPSPGQPKREHFLLICPTGRIFPDWPRKSVPSFFWAYSLPGHFLDNDAI